jgi:beta-glucanase (GH16 family)
VGRVWAAAAAGMIILSLAACQASGPGAPGSPSPAVAPPSPAAQPPSPVRTALLPAESTSAALTPAGNPPGPWRLAFDDAFRGGALNMAGWSTGWLAGGITPPVNSEELECYNPAEVSVSGGVLTLNLIRHTASCGGRSRPYTSGMVNTDGKFQFTYGFMEARIWMPGRGGRIIDWPAFWADGQNWPRDGEIDVLEGLGGQACWHFVNSAGTRGGCARGTFSNGWHTFGADWEPGSITYYYDGRVVGTIRSGITHAPMYLIINNATAHEFGIPVQVPASMRIAYVRVWQHPGQ